jgi:Invasion associated locus B (IalB) protein
MRIDRPPRLVLSLLVAGVFAVPAFAQQPPETAPAPAAAAPAPAKKPPKHKPAAGPAAVVAGGTKPTLLGQYGDWGAYTASPGGKKVCFAIAKPSTSETVPPGRPRNPSYMFISSRPADKVSNEVSIVIGYPFKPSTDATLAVGPTSFDLYTQQDGAWIKNAADEAHLVEAMRAGQNAVVKGVSVKGTHSTDIFSLKGLAQALDRTGQDCK